MNVDKREMLVIHEGEFEAWERLLARLSPAQLTDPSLPAACRSRILWRTLAPGRGGRSPGWRPPLSCRAARAAGERCRRYARQAGTMLWLRWRR